MAAGPFLGSHSAFIRAATKRPKPARLSTGLEIMVPEYIGTGERVLVNTTTGEFAGRAD